MRALDRYREMRDFTATPEPEARGEAAGLALRYSMQKHDATRLHFDLRLEWQGVLLSWAVTRGPSLDPAEKRLAVRTEDHPVSYLDFEGTIPKGSYGAGSVMLFDIGHWQPEGDIEKGLSKGHLRLRLHGRRLTGGWHLVRMAGRKPGDKGRENWLMIKEDDAAAKRRDPVARYRRSVATHRTMREIAAGNDPAPPDRTGKLPRYRKPQLASLSDDVPSGDGWWHELKIDGYRALVALGKGGPKVFTRNGHDWTDRFASLLPAFDEIDCASALIDGEIIAGAGLGGFSALQNAIKAGGPFACCAFDLLELDGTDLTGDPLEKRREALEDLLSPLPPMGQAFASEVLEGDGNAALAAICGAGGEGLISKLRSAPYRGRRTRAWIKTKCQRRDDFAIVGWRESDKRGRRIGALLLAEEADGGLTYVGKVGTGFSEATEADLVERLAKLAVDAAPTKVPRPEAKGATWVRPRLRAEVSYSEITDTGRLRHPTFEGLREDMIVTARGKDDGDSEKVAGVAITSPGRRVYPEAKVTKLDIARYYEAVADRMLPTVKDRPLSLVRLPSGLTGERFFQKHLGKGFPDGLKPVAITESDGDEEEYMYVANAAGLVGAAQMGTLEFHVWGARRDRIERPDRLVFDLDPDEGLDFARVREAAAEIRDRLEALDLASWPMLTGGKGVHVVVPLRRTASWETVKLFAQTLATLLATEAPDRYVAGMSKAKRRGKIFIDWLRNERGATAIAPFSLRAREGAPVAVPVSWEELAGIDRADAFTLTDVLAEPDRTVPDVPASSIGGKALERLSEKVQAARGA